MKGSLSATALTTEKEGRYALVDRRQTKGPSFGVGWPLLERIAPFVLPVTLLLLWHLFAVTGLLTSKLLPPPLAVLARGWELVQGPLWGHLAISTGRALAGLVLGGGIGFLLGLLTGTSKIAERFLDSTVQMFRTIPNLALIPLIILWIGIGEEAKVVLIAVGVFFPLYLNTYHGIRTVDPNLIEMAQVYGLRGVALFREVLFPGALPSILVGLRFALGSMWLTLIAAEALAAESGIGYMTATAREFMQTDTVIVGTIIYALLGKGADMIARTLERRLLRWRSRDTTTVLS